MLPSTSSDTCTSQKRASASASFSTTGVLDASSAGSIVRHSLPLANTRREAHITKHTIKRQSRKDRGKIFIGRTFRKNGFVGRGETEKAKTWGGAAWGDATCKDEAGL